MMKKILLIVAGTFSLATCGCACGRPSLKERLPETVTVSEADAGNTIHIARNGMVTVCLHGNRTTGFGWEVVTVSGLRRQGELKPVPDSGAIGAGATYRYSFEAAESGRATLKMAYRRPWENGAAPLKTFEVFFVVVGGR